MIADPVEAGRELAEAQIARSDAPEPEDDHTPVSSSTVEELRDRLAELQSTVEQLVSSGGPRPAPSGDPEIDSASRTLRFAQQTADAVVAEAREEAAAIVADAERQRSEIIRRARQQADQDYSAERDRVIAASAAWQEQRAEVLRQLDALTGVVAQYQGGLAHLDGTVASVTDGLRSGIAAEPSALTPEPESVEHADEGAVIEAAETAEGAEAAEATEAEVGPEPLLEVDSDAWIAPAEGAGSTAAELRPVDATTDPFMFDATELPETTGGLEHDGGTSTTF